MASRPGFAIIDYFELGADEALAVCTMVDEKRAPNIPVQNTAFKNYVPGYGVKGKDATPVGNVYIKPVCQFSATNWDWARSAPRQVFINGVCFFSEENRPKNSFFVMCFEKTQEYVCALLTTVKATDAQRNALKNLAGADFDASKQYYIQKAACLGVRLPYFAFAEALLKEIVKDTKFFTKESTKEAPKEVSKELAKLLELPQGKPGTVIDNLCYKKKELPKLAFPAAMGLPYIDGNVKELFEGFGPELLSEIFLDIFSEGMLVFVADSEAFLSRFTTAVVQLCYPFQPKCQRRPLADNDLAIMMQHGGGGFFLCPRCVYTELPKNVFQAKTTVFDLDKKEILVKGTQHLTVSGTPYAANYKAQLEADFKKISEMFSGSKVDGEILTLFYRTACIRYIANVFRLYREFLIYRSFVDFGAELNQDGYLKFLPAEESACMRMMLKNVAIAQNIKGSRPFPLADMFDHVIARQLWNYDLPVAAQHLLLLNRFLSSPMGDFAYFKDFERNVVKLSDMYEIGSSTTEVGVLKPNVVNVVEIDTNPVLMDFESNSSIFTSYNFHLKYPIRNMDKYQFEKVDRMDKVRIDLFVKLFVRDIIEYNRVHLVPIFSLLRDSRYFRYAFIRETMLVLSNLPHAYRLKENSFMLFKQLVNEILKISYATFDIACLLRIFEIMDRTHYVVCGQIIYMHAESILNGVISDIYSWLTFFTAEMSNHYCTDKKSNIQSDLENLLSLSEYKEGDNAERSVVCTCYSNFMRYFYDFNIQPAEFNQVFVNILSSKFLTKDDRDSLKKVFEAKKEYDGRDERQSPQTKYVVVFLDDKCHTRQFKTEQGQLITNEMERHKGAEGMSFLYMSSSHELRHWFGRHAQYLNPRKQSIRFVTNNFRPLDGMGDAPMTAMEIVHEQKGYEKAPVLVFCQNVPAAKQKLSAATDKSYVTNYYVTAGIPEVFQFIKNGKV